MLTCLMLETLSLFIYVSCVALVLISVHNGQTRVNLSVKFTACVKFAQLRLLFNCFLKSAHLFPSPGQCHRVCSNLPVSCPQMLQSPAPCFQVFAAYVISDRVPTHQGTQSTSVLRGAALQSSTCKLNVATLYQVAITYWSPSCQCPGLGLGPSFSQPMFCCFDTLVFGCQHSCNSSQYNASPSSPINFNACLT